jgi:circadian clock protein KaiC
MTVCDVILALRRSWRGSRHRRLLEVVKARGSRLLDGIHPFAIDQNGVSVFPRFETVVPTVQQAWAPRLAALGVPELDALLGGGLSAGTTTLVAGGPGVGKTTLGLHFIAEGIRAGEPGLLLGFMESAAQLREKARMFNINLGGAEAAGQLRLLVLPGYDLEADYIATLLREDVEGRGVRRLVVDSTKELERAVDSAERVPDFIAALVSYLRGQDVTTYLTLDIPRIVGTDLDFAGTPLSVMAENLILLRQVEYRGALHRVCSVLKMRFSNHDRALYEYTTVAGEGIRILGPAPLGEGLLTGIARPLVDIPLQRPAIGS